MTLICDLFSLCYETPVTLLYISSVQLAASHFSILAPEITALGQCAKWRTRMITGLSKDRGLKTFQLRERRCSYGQGRRRHQGTRRNPENNYSESWLKMWHVKQIFNLYSISLCCNASMCLNMCGDFQLLLVCRSSCLSFVFSN